MAKEKKISVNQFDTVLNSVADENPAEKTVIWNGLEIKVKTVVDYDTMLMIVKTAADACFTESGEFCPEVEDFVTRVLVLHFFTNLSLPVSREKKYYMVCVSGVYDAVVEAIDRLQYGTIVSAVSRRVEQRASAGVEAVIRQANSVSEAVAELRDKFEKEFSSILEGVTPEDMNRMIRRLADGEIDEGKIASAYLDNTRTIGEDMMDDGK